MADEVQVLQMTVAKPSLVWRLLGVRIPEQEQKRIVVSLPWWTARAPSVVERIEENIRREGEGGGLIMRFVWHEERRRLTIFMLTPVVRGDQIVAAMVRASHVDDPAARMLDGLPKRTRASYLLLFVVNLAAAEAMHLDIRTRAWIVGRVDHLTGRAQMQGFDVTDQREMTLFVSVLEEERRMELEEAAA